MAMIHAMDPQTAADSHSFSPSASQAGATPVRKFDAATVALCLQTVTQLRNGLTQALLYTEGTKQFERTCTTFFTAFETLLQKIGAFKFTIARVEPLFNGERIDSPPGARAHLEYIEKALSAANTAGLKFDLGLTLEEVGPFLQLLARRKFPAAESAKVNAFLRENGIDHIHIDELRYVALSEEQKIYTGDAPVLGTHANAQKNLSELVNATIASIDKINDGEARGQLRAELTDQLIEKSDEMLTNVLATASQRLKSNVSVEQTALVAVPQRDARLLTNVFEFAALLREKKMLDDPGIAQTLRKHLEGIVEPYKMHAEDILAHAVFEDSLLHLIPPWLLKARASLKGGSAAERWEGILSQSPCALLDEQMFHQIIDVLDELTVAAMDAEAEQLSAHIAGALRSPTKRERSKAVERLSFLLERSLEQTSPSLRIIEDGLLKACRHETCDEVMDLLLTHLAKRCLFHYSQKNYQRSMEHLDGMVNLEESSRLAMKDEGANLARMAREKLSATELAVSLPQDILDEGETGVLARKMIKLLGPGMFVAIIARLRFELVETKCVALARHLKAMGPDAINMFYVALGKESEGRVAVRMMALAPEVGGDEGLWLQVPALLLHQDGAVGTAALGVLMQRDGEEAVNVLCKVLRAEEDPERRKVWISALSQLKHLSAQQVLLAELEEAATIADADSELLMTVLEALSQAGNGGVIRVIATLVERTPLPPKPVLMTALKALAPFYTDPMAVATFERARKLKDPELARLALVCQRGIVAAEQQHTLDQEAVVEAELDAPASNTAQITKGRKTRRGFEALDREQIDDVFQVGVAVGKNAPAPEEPAPLAASPTRLSERSVGEMKPTLEGRVEDLGLARTVRIVGSKDGLLRIFILDAVGAEMGEGRIYIRGKKVRQATCGDRAGIRAMHSMDRMTNAFFAYYPASFTSDASLDIEIDKVQDALLKYRDQEDDNAYF